MRGYLKCVAGWTATAGVIAACGGGGGGGGGPSLTIAKAGAPNGDAQSAVVTSVLPDPLRVLVQEDGSPKAEVSVTWSTAATGASVSPTSSLTDAAGVATTQWTLGQGAGTQTAQAALSGASGSPVGFTATATPGAPTAFTKSAGDGQSTPISTAFAAALAAKVTDQFGNGIAGVTVDWAVQSGPVSLTGGATSTTNSQGIATKAVTAGGTPGAAVVRATTAAVAGTNLDFALTATLAPVRVSVGSNFFRSVKNSTQDPAVDTAAVGQPVVWSVTGSHTVRSLGSPSFTSSGTLVTGATYEIVFSTAGTYQYDCAIHSALEMNGRIVVTP
jgi:plastocyanin